MNIKRKLVILSSLIFILIIFTVGCSKKETVQPVQKESAQSASKEKIKFNQEEFTKSLNEWQSSPEKIAGAFEETNKNLVNSIGTDKEDYYMELNYNLLFKGSSVGDKSIDLEQYKKNVRKAYNDMKDAVGSKIVKYELSAPKSAGEVSIITSSVEYEKKTFINEYWIEKVGEKWFVKNFTSK